MEKEMSFHILGIEETKDETAVKMAYMRLLKETNRRMIRRALSGFGRRMRLRRRLPATPEEEGESGAGASEEKTELDGGSTGLTHATVMCTPHR